MQHSQTWGLDFGGPVWSQGLDMVVPVSPFQLKMFYGSVIELEQEKLRLERGECQGNLRSRAPAKRRISRFHCGM